MMTIRVRLIVMCLVVALLPAIPLSLVVQSLLDKSLDIGLHSSVERSLQSGLDVSRRHLALIRREFSLNVQRVADAIGDSRPDSAAAAGPLARVVGASGAVDGLLVSSRAADKGGGDGYPRELRPFSGHPALDSLIAGTGVIDGGTSRPNGFTFYGLENHSALVAVWNPAAAGPRPRATPGGEYRILFYKTVDPTFLADANRMIEGRQNVAALRLLRRSLGRSFFYPFIIIYAVCLAIALGLAMLMAERLADPIRRLVRGAGEVAAGDWNYRLDIKAGGETGRLVEAFNEMVAKLDTQRRRLSDMEKMETWREMARHLAHEIKNPMLPIRLTVEELRDMYEGDDPRFRQMLEESTRVVSDELGSLQKLVREFSSFAKMPDMNPVPGSLAGLARDVAQMYPQIATTFDAPGDLPEITFDPDQIRRVFVNLYDNAVSVGATGMGVTIAVSGDDVVAGFRDNGPGIAREEIDRVFDPYYTTRKDGTGLGLAMTKKIVLVHGGSITAASREGEGASFEIRLPISGPTA
ncbi:MAG: ATP-binding protein [Candidatus Latescibacterota bacterium]|jgi:nitrogen fixation/metabolism regulation signal transduction histidine kinase